MSAHVYTEDQQAPPEAITAAVDELTRDRSAMSLFSGQVNLKMN